MNSSRIDGATDFDCDGNNSKVIDEAELEAVIKSVRRAKQKKRDNEKWEVFLQSKYSKNSDDGLSTRSCTSDSCLKENNSFTIGPSDRHFKDSTSPQHLRNRTCINKNIRECSRATSEINFETNIEIPSHTYQLGPGLGKRLQDLLGAVNRMSSVLLSPCHQEMVGDEDVERTIKRSLEFDAMFSRNHLYEIQRMIKKVKLLDIAKVSNTAELEGKISSALKCVTQALQVYTKHISKVSRVKFQQLVPIFQSISLIHKLLEKLTWQHNYCPLRQDIEVSCSYLKQILLEINTTETRTVSTSSWKPTRARIKHKPSSDLSMYSRQQKSEWRKKSAYLAHAKFGSPQSKTHGYAKPVNKSNAKDVTFRNATRAVPEENITTMMEMIPIEDYIVQDVADGQRLDTKINEPDSNSITRRNVQIIYMKEDDKKTDLLTSKGNEVLISISLGDTALPPSDRINDSESPECAKNSTHIKSPCPQYKDGQAVTTVERLANRILKDMIIEYQKEEIDEIVDLLYKLEFK